MASNDQQSEALRQTFKQLNHLLMVPMWRLGLGQLVNSWPDVFGQIMVIAHVGRKSGKLYHTPVNYAIVGRDVYCVVGFGEGTDWYRNVQANPAVEVWLPHGWWKGVAEDASDAPNRLDIVRKILIAGGFAAPLFGGFDPKTISEEELQQRTADYRLVRIRRTDERTGPGGPGEYAWVWPLATMALAGLLLVRPRKRR